MIISIIAAMSRNRVIGNNNQLPWHLPADLRHFKQLTLDKPIVMGRKTFVSIGKPLPKRHNIVVTRQTDIHTPGITIVHSLEDALRAAGSVPEVMIIGGADVFQQALPHAQRMYLTIIEHEFAGDTFFPQWETSVWNEIERNTRPADDNNPYPMTFVTFDRTLS